MSDTIAFRYRFTFEDNSEKQFSILLNARTLDYIPSSPQKELPDWTKLEYSQCENCPLNAQEHPRCPIAVNIIELFEFFRSVDSYDDTIVEIEAPERTYIKKSTVQRGLGSLLGIFMVTSGCPVMEVLKPMVRFHLPFASIEETVFRSVGSYLIGQYFLQKSGRLGDFELSELRTLYLEIQKVNTGIVRRLRPAIVKDALANAIISLDAFAKELPWSIEDELEELQHLYTGYFGGLFPFKK
ncbi:hypothetical protein B6D60_06540 [candidate division KSB1 bacterium 4484_87]|nr:MAG: hypothetical protein B6D60_06540 [candidate division KSB1 bacterium 4484_87]